MTMLHSSSITTTVKQNMEDKFYHNIYNGSVLLYISNNELYSVQNDFKKNTKIFNLILPKVNTDYIRQAQVLNIDNLRLIIQ